METVAVAVVGAIGLVASSWIQSGRHKNLEKTLGQRNGHTVVEKLDSLISWTERHEGRHDILEDEIRDLGRDHNR